MEQSGSIYLEGISPDHTWEPFSKYIDKYDHPLWKGFDASGVKGGHGGMDWHVLRAYVESAKKKNAPPIDVYDMASWMSITALSEQSIILGSQAVAIPDFTNGRWLDNTMTAVSGKYSLDIIDDSEF